MHFFMYQLIGAHFHVYKTGLLSICHSVTFPIVELKWRLSRCWHPQVLGHSSPVDRFIGFRHRGWVNPGDQRCQTLGPPAYNERTADRGCQEYLEKPVRQLLPEVTLTIAKQKSSKVGFASCKLWRKPASSHSANMNQWNIDS